MRPLLGIRSLARAHIAVQADLRFLPYVRNFCNVGCIGHGERLGAFRAAGDVYRGSTKGEGLRVLCPKNSISKLANRTSLNPMYPQSQRIRGLLH